MEKRRDDKLKKDENENKIAEEARIRELENQRKKEKSRQKYLDNQKKLLLQKKQQELDELKTKKEMEELKNKEIHEKMQKEKKEFLKREREKLKKNFDGIIQERENLKKAQADLEYEKEVKKKKIMDNMVNYLKEHKEDRELEANQIVEVNQFYIDHHTVFEDHENELRRAFTHYSKQNAKTLDNKLDANVKTIDMTEFVKLGKHTKVVPALLTNDTLLHIYRMLARERIENSNEIEDLGLVLDYEAFKKSLILISIEGREVLGGSLKPKNEEEEKYTSRYQISTRNKSRDKNRNSKSPAKKTIKTIEGKKIKEIFKKKPTYETEIKDLKISRQYDVSSITPQTVESLISYCDFIHN